MRRARKSMVNQQADSAIALTLPTAAELSEVQKFFVGSLDSNVILPSKDIRPTAEYLANLPLESKIYLGNLKRIFNINRKLKEGDLFIKTYKKNDNEIRQNLLKNQELVDNLEEFKRVYFEEIKKIGYDKYQEIKNLNAELIEKRNDIIQYLWNIIEKYAIGRIHYHLKPHQSFAHSDSFHDLYADVFAKFSSVLLDYNPLYYKPTTYFHFYFDEAITDYIRKNLTHLTQNDTKNIREIKEAINYFEDLGVEWNDEILATYLNKTVNVVKKFRKMAANTGYVDIDEQINLVSNIDTPEAQLEEKEYKEAFLKAIKDELTELEQRLVQIKYYDPDLYYTQSRESSENDNANYKQRFPSLPNKKVAEIMGLPIRDINNMSNQINQKLRSSKTLMQILNRKEKEINQLEFQDSSANILSQQIMDVDLSGLSLSNF